jgi:TonB family protein
MKTLTLIVMLFLVLSSKAQNKSTLPTIFSLKNKALIAQILTIEKEFGLTKENVVINRFKNGSVDRDSTYYDVEIPAFFSAVPEDLSNFINQNLIRPRISKGEVVLVKFVVERYGELNKIHVLSSSSDSLLSAEAIKVVRKMGAWNPAKIQGVEVASYYVLPIKF